MNSNKLNTNPKVSIIIPAYNAEQYIDQCIDSALNQTLEDIEIICIDDFSSDNTLDKLKYYADRDVRVKIIKNKINEGILISRKKGVNLSTGNTIMFLDSDDYLENIACEYLYNIYNTNHADIIHFNATVFPNNNDEYHDIENSIKPNLNVIYQEKILDDCFIRKNHQFTLWNKIFKGDICRKSFQYISNVWCCSGEDILCYFLIVDNSCIYKGINSPSLYNYRLGNGITSKKYSYSLTYNDFLKFNSSKVVLDEIDSYISSHEKTNVNVNKYYDIRNSIYGRLLNEIIWRWFAGSNINDSSRIFDLLVLTWGFEDIFKKIVHCFNNDKELISKRIYNSLVIQSKSSQIRSIGIYYYKLSHGGAERVVSRLAKILHNCGFKVYLITDHKISLDDYNIPEYVKRIELGQYNIGEPQQLIDRYLKLKSIIYNYELDLFIHNAATYPAILYDILAVKSLGKTFFIINHESFASPLTWLGREFYLKSLYFKLVDKVITLSRIDEIFYKEQGVNAKYIPNPFSFENEELVRSKLNTFNVLWVGRISHEKRIYDAVYIIKIVRKYIKDVKLIIVGNFENDISMSDLTNHINEEGLWDSIIIFGYTKDIMSLYSISDVYLSTSLNESFSMSIYEAKSIGVPTVMYEIPHIEFSRRNKGIVTVTRRDFNAAANEIIGLFLDRSKLKSLGEDAYQDFIAFSEESNVQNEWLQLIYESTLEVNENKITYNSNSDLEIIFQTISNQIDTGIVNFYWNNSQNTHIDKYIYDNSVYAALISKYRFIPGNFRKPLAELFCTIGTFFNIKLINNIGVQLWNYNELVNKLGCLEK